MSHRPHESFALHHLRAELSDGPDAWLVGGAVRDRLLGRRTDDLDLVLATSDGDVVRRVARGVARRAAGHAFPLSDAYGAWRVTGGEADGWQVDLTPLQGADLAEDLSRRDLTVNAVAEPVAGGALVDPFDGAGDLEARRLRAVGPEAFSSDPVRVLRLARFAAELQAEPDPETLRAATAAAPALQRDVPGERMLPELARALTGPGWERGLRIAVETGALAAIVPAAVRSRTPATASGTAGTGPGPGVLRPVVADALSSLLGDPPALPAGEPDDVAALRARTTDPPDRLVLLLAALLRHAPDPGRALDVLRPSRDLRAAVVRTVSAISRIAALGPTGEDPSALFAALGPAGTSAPHAVLVAHAVLGPEAAPWPVLVARAVRWAAGPPRPPLTGDELADALGLRPGPELGRLLRALAVAHDAGTIDSRDDAVVLARRLAGAVPGTPVDAG